MVLSKRLVRCSCIPIGIAEPTAFDSNSAEAEQRLPLQVAQSPPPRDAQSAAVIPLRAGVVASLDVQVAQAAERVRAGAPVVYTPSRHHRPPQPLFGARVIRPPPQQSPKSVREPSVARAERNRRLRKRGSRRERAACLGPRGKLPRRERDTRAGGRSRVVRQLRQLHQRRERCFLIRQHGEHGRQLRPRPNLISPGHVRGFRFAPAHHLARQIPEQNSETREIFRQYSRPISRAEADGESRMDLPTFFYVQTLLSRVGGKRHRSDHESIGRSRAEL